MMRPARATITALYSLPCAKQSAPLSRLLYSDSFEQDTLLSESCHGNSINCFQTEPRYPAAEGEAIETQSQSRLLQEHRSAIFHLSNDQQTALRNAKTSVSSSISSSSSSSSRFPSWYRSCSPFHLVLSQQQFQQIHSPHNPRHLSSTSAPPPPKPTSSLDTATIPASETNTATGAAAAAATTQKTWLRHLPSNLLPYTQLMRLDKPIGTWLLLWPCFWSIALAASPGQLPDLKLLMLFGAGAVLLRGAGCTVNDLWDMELDKKVERTRSRPLASGALVPMQAVGLLAAQLSLGLCILLQLNDFSKLLGASSLLLVGTYPLMKRVTHWPQAFLGLTINWGALLGWAAVHGSCDWVVLLPLYFAGVNWTLVYDTIYAHQDTRDDLTAGMGSTALLFGDNTKAWVSGFATCQVACLVAAGMASHSELPFYMGVAACATHLAWQIRSADLHNPADCMAKFVSNKWLGGIMFTAIVADRFMMVAV